MEDPTLVLFANGLINLPTISETSDEIKELERKVESRSPNIIPPN